VNEPTVQLDINQLCELLTTFDQTSISELTLKSADFELMVRKGVSVTDRAMTGIEPTIYPGPLTPIVTTPAPVTHPTTITLSEAVPSKPAPATPSPPPPQADTKGVAIVSPMVGTFYRSPAPDEPPFVNVGDRVSIGQTVCIIEAMKLMNEIEAEVSGRVVEILVQNSEPVEYGQPLMRISPD
jgi:acetyl-CoA carboxylase biotin carboxyl carrier protein